MPDSDPKQDNARDTPNLPAVVQEGEVLRPAADNWLMRAIRTAADEQRLACVLRPLVILAELLNEVVEVVNRDVLVEHR